MTLRNALVFLVLLCAVALPLWLARRDDGPAVLNRSSSGYLADGSRADKTTDTSARPNLILVVIDTLRRDAVRPGDASTATMPRLSEWATNSVACEEAIAPSSWTAPSIATLLTGLHPNEHGAIHSKGQHGIAPGVVTYAEVLRNTYGYETAAFTDAPWLRITPGSLLQGFVRGSTNHHPALPGTPMEGGFSLARGPEVLDAWMKARDKTRPFFLLLHTFEVHDPYGVKNHGQEASPEAFAAFQSAVGAFDASSIRSDRAMVRQFFLDVIGRAKLFQQHGPGFVSTVTKYLYSGLHTDPDVELIHDVRTAYDEGARAADVAMADLNAYLQDKGLLENTLLVVTSDHGEAFGEHQTLGHGQTLHHELVRIPLLLRGPAPFDQPRLVKQPVGLIDVMPTFFDWIDVPTPRGARGISLLPMLRDEDVAPRVVQSETLVSTHMTQPGVRHLLVSVRTDEWMYLLRRELDRDELVESLFDLKADPEEMTDLAEEGRVVNMPPSIQIAVDAARDMVAAQPGPGSGRIK